MRKTENEDSNRFHNDHDFQVKPLRWKPLKAQSTGGEVSAIKPTNGKTSLKLQETKTMTWGSQSLYSTGPKMPYNLEINQGHNQMQPWEGRGGQLGDWGEFPVSRLATVLVRDKITIS